MTLPNGWHRNTLNDCVELLTGYAFSSQAYADTKTFTIRLLRGDNVMQGSLRWDDAKHWATPYDKQLVRYEMRKGDIVIAMDRPITNAGLKCSIVQAHDLPCLLVQRVARMRAKENFDQDYLAQVLQTHSFIQHLKGQKTETAVPHISPNDRSGSACLNNFPRFISGPWAGCKRCRVVHGGERRLRRTHSRGGQLGAHQGFHFRQPVPVWAARPRTPARA